MGAETTLAENVIKLHYRRRDVERCDGGGTLAHF